MLQIREEGGFLETTLPRIGSQWTENRFLDARLVCGSGPPVPCSRLVLAAHSPFLAGLLNQDGEDDLIILLPDFSVEVTRNIIALLHGVGSVYSTHHSTEALQLLHLLNIPIRSDAGNTVGNPLKRQVRDDEEEEEGVFLTFGRQPNNKSARSAAGDWCERHKLAWRTDCSSKTANSSTRAIQGSHGYPRTTNPSTRQTRSSDWWGRSANLKKESLQKPSAILERFDYKKKKSEKSSLCKVPPPMPAACSNSTSTRFGGKVSMPLRSNTKDVSPQLFNTEEKWTNEERKKDDETKKQEKACLSNEKNTLEDRFHPEEEEEGGVLEEADQDGSGDKSAESCSQLTKRREEEYCEQEEEEEGKGEKLSESSSQLTVNLAPDKYRTSADGSLLIDPAEAARIAADHFTCQKSETGDDNLFSCTLCQRFEKKTTFQSKDEMLGHVFRHLNLYTAECPNCSHLFRSEILLKSHSAECLGKNRQIMSAGSETVALKPKVPHLFHFNKKMVFMSEERAHQIISSYIVRQAVQKETSANYECSLCSVTSHSERDVFEHVSLEHLSIYQQRCVDCGQKFKLRRQLEEHEGSCGSRTGKVEELESEKMVVVQSDDGSYEIMALEEEEEEDEDENETDEEDEKEGPTEGVKESFFPKTSLIDWSSDIHPLTLQVPVVEKESDRCPDDFPYEDHGMAVITSATGIKKIIVQDAELPLMRASRAAVNRIAYGRLLSRDEADRTISCWTLLNTLTTMYECTVCNGAFKVDNLRRMQRHLYDHFNIYFFRCDRCKDLFRTEAQWKVHLDAHARLEVTGEQAQAKAMIGSYHTATDWTYIPQGQAKLIVESYFTTMTEPVKREKIYSCMLCPFIRPKYAELYAHCLKAHLKIHQYRCQLCDHDCQLPEEMRLHYRKEHAEDYVDNSAKGHADSHEESGGDETDLPGQTNLYEVDMNELRGKKISAAQAKTLRGRFVIYNEDTKRHECQLCPLQKECKATVQYHVLSAHCDVYIYRCPIESCRQSIRNLRQLGLHRKQHQLRAKRGAAKSTSSAVHSDYHLLKEPVYLGEKEGMKVAKFYVFYSVKLKKQMCKMCDYTANKVQLVALHALAIHLPCVNLFRCEECGKMFRYSRHRFVSHIKIHQEGKLPCPDCPADQQQRLFTRDTLKAHQKRDHQAGQFWCEEDGCGEVYSTRGQLKIHHQLKHQDPKKEKSFICELCDYSFPTRSRWKKHVAVCEKGRTRTLFRKQMSDVLQYLGKGSYRCTFCDEIFHPVPGNPSGAGLPEARDHVVKAHGMRHMRNFKMQWYGDPANLPDKKERYKDKSSTWNQKMKDIEKARNLAIQESSIQAIQHQVNQTIASAAKSYDDSRLIEERDNRGTAIYLRVVNQDGEVEDWKEEKVKKVDGDMLVGVVDCQTLMLEEAVNTVIIDSQDTERHSLDEIIVKVENSGGDKHHQIVGTIEVEI